MQSRSAPSPNLPARANRRWTLRTGVWPTLFVCLYTGAYVGVTWSEPHRSTVAAAIVVAVIASIGVTMVPLERVLRSRWTELFFLAYSAILIALVTAAIVADGGSASPMVPLLFLPLVYAAVSYPVLSMLLVGLMDLGAFLLVATLAERPVGMYVFMFASSLAAAAWICAWLSHNHERDRYELARASRTDPLTGCLNRRGFEESFAVETARARRAGGSLTLLLVDLDHFKAVNDAHGHAAGDELLCWVSDALHAELRAHDVVARLGGDEFALLTDAEPSRAAERVVAVLAERAPACVGSAVFPEDGSGLDELSRVADDALYACKRTRGPRDALAA